MKLVKPHFRENYQLKVVDCKNQKAEDLINGVIFGIVFWSCFILAAETIMVIA